MLENLRRLYASKSDEPLVSREVWIDKFDRTLSVLEREFNTSGWWIIGGVARDAYMKNEDFPFQQSDGSMRDVDILVTQDKISSLPKILQLAKQEDLLPIGTFTSRIVRIEDRKVSLKFGNIKADVQPSLFETRYLPFANGTIPTLPPKTLLYLMQIMGIQRDKDVKNIDILTAYNSAHPHESPDEEQYAAFKAFVEKVGQDKSLSSYFLRAGVVLRESPIGRRIPFHDPKFRPFLDRLWENSDSIFNAEESNSFLQHALKAGSGLIRARRSLGRPIINGFESAVFAGWYASITTSPLNDHSIESAVKLQDILERQNCFGDEIVASLDSNPYEQRPHFIKEHDRLYSQIYTDLCTRYGQEEGQKRALIIKESLANWFGINLAVEKYITQGCYPTDQNQGSTIARDEIFQLEQSQNGHLTPEQYRSLVDKYWIKCITLVLNDGDYQKTEIELDLALQATLIYQLSEDFANIKRDQHIYKRNYFISYSNKSMFQRLKILNGMGKEKFNDLKMGSPTKELVTYAWIIRSLLMYFKASLSKSTWRDHKLYDRVNNFEEKNTNY